MLTGQVCDLNHRIIVFVGWLIIPINHTDHAHAK